MRRLLARILFQALWQPWRAQLGQIWDKGPRWAMGQLLPRLHSLLLPNLVSGMSDIAPDFKGWGEKWFLSVFMAASALLYRNDLQGWADGQLAHLGLSKDVRSRLRGGPGWRGWGALPFRLASLPLSNQSGFTGATCTPLTQARVVLGCWGRRAPGTPPVPSLTPSPPASRPHPRQDAEGRW